MTATLSPTGQPVTLIGHGSIVSVGDTLYLCRDRGAGQDWSVTKLDETHAEYFVKIYGNKTATCTCPDAKWRARRCKHQLAIGEAMREW